MGEDTHKLMLGHSQAKVKLYGNYLEKYLNIISQDKFTTTIHLYDLFSGQGIYEDGEKGSPIIAIDKIKSYAAENERMPKIKITFNDKDSTVASKLSESLKTVSVPSNCTTDVYNKDYLELLDQVYSEIALFKNEKAVVFLDPKGYKEISVLQIKKLMANGKAEVLLFLPIRDMFRFANLTDNEIKAGHEPLHKFISEIFPNQKPFFQSQIDFIYKIKDGLKAVLPECFVDTFTLERETGQFFCLFFFTSHIKGFEKMLETKWEIDDGQGRGWKHERTVGLFSGVETFNLEEKLTSYLSTGKKFNSDVYEYCLHQGFLPKHANEIFRDWQQKGTVDVYNKDGTVGRKNSFYLNYDSYKDEAQKVYYTIKLTLF